MIETIQTFPGMTVDQAKDTIISHRGEVFTYWDEGCSRYVFVNKNETRVIKIEKYPNGENQKELDIYLNASDEDVENMAHTDMSLGIIEQEFVLPHKWAGQKLDMKQIQFSMSCRGGVGWKGDRLVCFDLDEYKKY